MSDTPKKSRMLDLLKLALFGYLAYALLLFALQRSMLFPGQYADVGQRGPYTYLELDTDEGPVEAIMLEAPEPVAGLVVWAHGNGEVIDGIPPAVRPYTQMGFHVLIPEYRGYGRSAGKPAQAAIVDDYIDWVDKVRERDDLVDKPIIYHGTSLGGGVVSSLSSMRPPSALILQSTFTKVSGFALRYGVPPLLVRDPFDSASTLEEWRGPTLIMHGSADEVIPVKHGRELHRALPDSTYVEVEAGHAMPMNHAYWQRIESFLEDADLLPAR